MNLTFCNMSINMHVTRFTKKKSQVCRQIPTHTPDQNVYHARTHLCEEMGNFSKVGATQIGEILKKGKHLSCICLFSSGISLSGVLDLFDRNKILSGGDLSHYQVPHCIRVFFYFVWFVFIHHNFQFYFELCTYCNILDIYLS